MSSAFYYLRYAPRASNVCETMTSPNEQSTLSAGDLSELLRGAIGVLYALADVEVETLRAQDDPAVFVSGFLDREFASSPEWVGDLGEAWYAIHALLTSQVLVAFGDAKILAAAVLGGERLRCDREYMITMKSAEEVRAIAERVARLKREELFCSIR
jgi:hypothetical protein